MKCIESHWRAGIRPLLIGVLLLAVAQLGAAARGPKYGGTLRVELLTAKVSLDPREWKPGTEEFAEGAKLAGLVFDRLVMLDDYGRFQRQLAAAWTHDAEFKRWQFTIRGGVKFSDGTPMTARDAAMALRTLLPASRQMAVIENSVVIQSAEPMPELLEELASGPNFIFRVPPGGGLLGTGPFVEADASKSADAGAADSDLPTAAPRRVFHANEECWAGRPFVDSIEVTLGVPPLRQLYDLQLGKADVIELTPDLVRRATQAGLKTWASTPVKLFALVFDDAQPAAQDARLREAVSLLLDRVTMAGVLLQKQAEPSAALLPQWLSGYAFVFNVDANPTRAKEIRDTLPANTASVGEPLRLRVDARGDVAKLLADRVAFNARQSQIVIQVVNRAGPRGGDSATPTEPAAGLHLVTWRFASLSPRAEFGALAAELGLNAVAVKSENGTPGDGGLEELYARERRVLEERRIVPLVAALETAGIGGAVRDWMPSNWGEWRLADVWLDRPDAMPAAKPEQSNPAPEQAAPPGGKP